MVDHNPTYRTSFYALSQEQIECIWDERAPKFARVEVVQEPGKQLAVVLIRLGSELYGLPLEYVSGIRPQETLIHTSTGPDWVMGVVDLRVRVLSVIDLRQYLGLPPAAQPGAGAFVTAKTPSMEAIIFVDDVPGTEVLSVSQDFVSAGIQLPKGCAAIVERWAGPDQQPYIAVIDIQALLSDPRLLVQK